MRKAQTDAGSRGAYAPPSTHQFRPEHAARHVAGEFELCVHVPTRQQEKIGAARNQGGMMRGPVLTRADLQPERCNYDPRVDGKALYHSAVPSTANKTASLQLRIDVSRDQGRLWEGGCSIQEHSFRGPSRRRRRRSGEEVRPLHSQLFDTNFHLPDHSREMATGRRFPVFDQQERPELEENEEETADENTIAGRGRGFSARFRPKTSAAMRRQGARQEDARRGRVARRPASASASAARSGRSSVPGHISDHNRHHSSRAKGKRNQDVAIARQSRTHLRRASARQSGSGHDRGTVPLAWDKTEPVTERLVSVGMDSITSLPSECLDLDLSSPSVWDEMRALRSKSKPQYML